MLIRSNAKARIPQGLKPAEGMTLIGMAEAMPFQDSFVATQRETPASCRPPQAIRRYKRCATQAKETGEEGYVLLGVLFLVFLVLVALSIAAPRMAKSIERDKEVEMQHRAKQYVRAIKLYYKKFGAYPPSIEALEKQNEIRFLRKRYKDPITGKDDWKLIHFGQNKLPTAYGFFGQPIAGSSIAGIGPGATGAAGGGLFGNSGASALGGSGGIGSNGLGSSGLGSSNGFGSTGSSGFGSTSSSGFGSTSTTTAAGSTDSSGNSTSGTSSTGTSGTGTSGTGTSTDANGNSSSSGGTGSSGSAFGSNGQTFGGAGIIGVESTSPKQAILEYKKKTHFNEWEFVYDPLADQIVLSNNTNIGTPASGLSPNGVSTPGTFGGQQTNTGFPQQQQQQQQPSSTATPQQQQ